MSIQFRIATAADDHTPSHAIITARQLAAFRHFLIQEGARTGIVLIDPEAAEESDLAHRFEARICPVALARFARLFDYDAAAIGVIEEAQFQARRVSICRIGRDGDIAMKVSLTSDLALELNLAAGNAYALLESLGLDPDSVGETSIADIRARLTDPAVQRRCAANGVAHYCKRLDRLLATADADETNRLELA
jgi:hypothetical protein